MTDRVQAVKDATLSLIAAQERVRAESLDQNPAGWHRVMGEVDEAMLQLVRAAKALVKEDAVEGGDAP